MQPLRLHDPARWLPVAVIALGFLVIAPALWSGWGGDDSFYSALNGILGADRISLSQAMAHSFDIWMAQNGRFYPGLILEKYVVFHIFTNLIAYKVFLIAMTLTVVELFRRCVAAYASPAIGNLAALLAVTLFAERAYQDPILAYNAMPQFVAIAQLASLMFFRRALRGGGAGLWAASAACYAIAALTYEDVYPLCLLYPAIAYFSGKRRGELVRAALPYLAIAAVLTTFALIARASVHVAPGSLYAAGSDPFAIARTAVVQIVAAFPVNYWLFDPQGIFDRSSVSSFYRNAPVSPVILLGFGFAAWYAVREAARSVAKAVPLAWVGAMLAVLPALPIAVALKYQHELRFGLGYLPVFFQAFGVALIGAALAIAVTRRFPSPRVPMALAAAIAICGAMTQATNERTIFEGWPSRTARAALERRLSQGLAAGVPDGQTVTIATNFDWIAFGDSGPDGISTRGLFFMYGGKRVNLVPPSDPSARYVLQYDAATHSWSIASR